MEATCGKEVCQALKMVKLGKALRVERICGDAAMECRGTGGMSYGMKLAWEQGKLRNKLKEDNCAVEYNCAVVSEDG